MLRKLIAWLPAVLVAFWVGLAGAEELKPVPALTARVTDQTGTFSREQRTQLEAKLATFESEKGSQIVVLVVPTVKPEAIEQYAIRAAESWKLGRKSVDDGALLIVAKADKALRIEVGYGLEGALTDAASKRIISEIIVPHFKQGDYFSGIDAGTDAMIKIVRGESLPAPRSSSGGASGGIGDIDSLLPIGFVLVFVVGGILRAIFGRFLAAVIVGGIAGLIAWTLVASMIVGGIVSVIAFVVSLFAGLSGGRGGFSVGGFSSGGGGGGGFSGGGGSFGGGGASGNW